MKRNFIFQLLTVGVTLSLCACGANKESNQSSTNPRGNLPGPAGSQFAECSETGPNNVFIEAQLASYYYNGNSNNDYIQMNLDAVPAEFFSQDFSIQVFRFKEPTAGARQVNSIPVPMYLVNKLSGQILNQSGATDRLSRTVFESLIAANGLSNLNITATNFLDNYYVLLTGMEYQWEAISIRLYNGSSLAGAAESLLPPFYADPNIYAGRVPVPALQALHPLIHLANSGASEAEFKRLADEICLSFFGTIRNTASVEDLEPQGFLGWFKNIWNKILSWF